MRIKNICLSPSAFQFCFKDKETFDFLMSFERRAVIIFNENASLLGNVKQRQRW